MNGGLEVRVEGTRVVRLVATPPLAAKVLVGPDGPVLMVVGSAAGLLAGDTVRVRVDLGPGSRLTLRTTAATIALPCPDGQSTAFEAECRLGPGAHLDWLPEPLIACAGCHHYGRSRLFLAPGATATWLDAVTLGRTGERPGRLELRFDAELDSRPLLREGLRIGPPPVGSQPRGDGRGREALGRDAPGSGAPGSEAPCRGAPGSEALGRGAPAPGREAPGWDGPAILSQYRHVAALHLLGRRLPSDALSLEIPGLMQLAGPGTTVRLLAQRGDELARAVAAVLPHFLPPTIDPAVPSPGRTGQPAKEAVHA